MKRMPARSVLASLALACAAPTTALALPTAVGSSKNVTVTLVSERDAVEPGRPLVVGLQLQMAPDWHTYWLNPGDSGLPTRIKWRLPEGFEAGPLQWPRPQRIPADPLMSYGYEGQVLLLTEIRTPSAFAEPQATLAARVDWLECKEACLPGKAELELRLPVTRAEASPLAEWAPAFRAARASLPLEPKGVEVEAALQGDVLTLAVNDSPGARSAYFFPAKADAIDHAAAQRIEAGGSGFRLQIPRAANAPELESLAGVLELDGRAYAIDVSVRPAAAAATPSAAGAETPAATAAPATLDRATSLGAVASSLPVALAFAFLGGLLLNLMPCVLPVLSLKVMGFVRHGGESRQGAIRHGLAFALGVLVFFWILAGALLALRAGGQQIGWGFQLQSPAFVVFLAALFLLVALNLFGVFEVGQSLTAAANLTAGGGGLAKSFWSGALATIVATPCTAPFMGSAMGFAISEPAWSTLLVFSALGLGMAAPYLVLAASPRLLRLLPRPGRWMETFKQAMGFPMLATVVFLVWLLGRQIGLNAAASLLGSLLSIAMGAWLYGRGMLPNASARGRLASIGLGGALVVGGLLFGMARAQAAASALPTQADAHGWQPYSEQRLLELRRAGTPVFVDFTADWCLTCQVNDRVALSRPEVQARFREEGVVLMKGDWTLRDEAITRALAGHGRQGVPLYVLYGRGADAPARLLPEVLTPGVVLSALEATF